MRSIEITKLCTTTVVELLLVIAFILMCFEVSGPFSPTFACIDISVMYMIIGAFAYRHAHWRAYRVHQECTTIYRHRHGK